MNRCTCNLMIGLRHKKGLMDDDAVFKSCQCSRSCQYCAERNLHRTDFSFRK